MIKLVVIILVLFPQLSFACRTLPIGDNYPKQAQAIYLGNINANAEIFSGISLTSIDFQQVTLKISHSRCGPPSGLTDYGPYLFLSIKEQKDLDVNPNVQAGDGMFFHLARGKYKDDKVIDMLSNNKELTAHHENKIWGYCIKDDDCINLNDKCEQRFGINAKYEKNFLDFQKNKPKAVCKKTDKKNINSSKCVDYFCS